MTKITSRFNLFAVTFTILSLLLSYGAVISARSVHGKESDSTGYSSRKIVVWKTNVSDAVKTDLLNRRHALREKELKLINGSVVTLKNYADERDLKNSPEVLRVDEDAIATVQAKPNQTDSLAAQVLPWGIDKIDAEQVWPTGNTANPIKVAVIDTGISSSHSDLVANIKGGYNAISTARGWNDDNGHGSHVAGIIGALNNTVGVVGVAPGVDLYAVKVLGRNGSGYYSDIIEGIDWARTNGMQVINMSFGGSSDVQSLHDAVIAAHNAGVVLVAAAGNSGGSVIFPAAYPEVIAVSATDANNAIASWSSRGPEVDIAAPGVNIYSTYKGTSYATLSGTSMATPHVVGTAALVLNSPVGGYDANSNGRWDPDEVAKKIEDKATDIGASGYDTLYGWGLLSALKATQ